MTDALTSVAESLCNLYGPTIDRVADAQVILGGLVDDGYRIVKQTTPPPHDTPPTDDPSDWAAAFCKTNPGDEHGVEAWFACAMEAARSFGHAIDPQPVQGGSDPDEVWTHNVTTQGLDRDGIEELSDRIADLLDLATRGQDWGWIAGTHLVPDEETV